RLTVDELMAASRRRLQRRRRAGSSAVAVAAITVLPAMGTARLGTSLLNPPRLTTPTRATTMGPGPALRGVTPTEDPGAARSRLGAAMRSAVSTAAPGAMLSGEFTVRHGATEAQPGTDGTWTAPSYYFEGEQIIDAAGIHGVITISVSRLV